MPIGFSVPILVPLCEGEGALVIIEPEGGFSFDIQVIGFQDEQSIFEEAAYFGDAVAVPVHAFLAEGGIFIVLIEDVGDTVFIQVIGFGWKGGRAGPRQAGAGFGAVEGEEAEEAEQKSNPSVFGFAHKCVVAYP